VKVEAMMAVAVATVTWRKVVEWAMSMALEPE
jgi:hypothetical protein